jgi:hypothetical protein
MINPDISFLIFFPPKDEPQQISVIFAVRLANGGLHPFDSLVDDLVDGPTPFRRLCLLLAQRLGNDRPSHALQGVDPAAGMLYRESLGVVLTEPSGALPAAAAESEIKGRGATGDDRDIEAAGFAVVHLDPLIDPSLAHAVGEDDAAVAGALVGGFGRESISHVCFLKGWGQALEMAKTVES